MNAKDFMLVAKLILLISSVQSSVNKIDVTVRQKDDRFVDLNYSHDRQMWALLPYGGAGYTTRFNIGRICDTGTGTVGGISHPSEGDLPDYSGFPPRSTVKYEDKSSHSRMIITLKGNSTYQVNHIGAFFIETVEGGQMIKIIAIKTAKAATIIPVEYTTTASIGDAVTLAVVSSISNQATLRWRHNGENVIDAWKGETNVTIQNIRKADEGIYECFEDHKRAEGMHAIMRLIVRACPDGLYGQSSGCLNECQTCYNGGVCDDETGLCVCPSGFMGVHCEHACGNNHFGAECDIMCSDRGTCGFGHNYFCPPDPVGCSCIAGFHTDSCDTPCSTGSYGADCKQTCHCSTVSCDAALGCTDTNACAPGYGGPQCQVPDICAKGYFGELCQYVCHCKDDVSCDKVSGTCINGGECANGWGGIDNCQQALPALFGHPYVESNTQNASLVIDWNDWSPSIDFGTGPIESYKVYYGKEVLSDSLETQISRVVLYNMERGPVYHMAISVIRKIGNALFEGILGNIVTARVSCEGAAGGQPVITF